MNEDSKPPFAESSLRVIIFMDGGYVRQTLNDIQAKKKGDTLDQRKGKEEGRTPASLRHAGGTDPQHLQSAPRLLSVREGRPIRHRGQQGRHRGRIYRPQNAGAPLERRIAPGGGSEGRRPD